MWQGSVYLGPPMVWTLMFVLLFTIGGLTGLINACLSLDVHLHDTSWVVAHFHFTMFGGTGVIFFAALHYWWPKMFGRMYNFKTAMIAAGLFFVGFNATYIPLFVAGGVGNPRRIADYLDQFAIYHQASTIGSWFMFTALLIMFVNLIVALWTGKRAVADPWGGATLEWRTASPPPTLNFDGPVDMSRGTYEYPTTVKDD